jgi:hypothetical protein
MPYVHYCCCISTQTHEEQNTHPFYCGFDLCQHLGIHTNAAAIATTAAKTGTIAAEAEVAFVAVV